MDRHREKVDFVWSVADLLRGDYKRSDYGKVILPLTVLRRLDQVLEPTKPQVLKRHAELQGRLENVDAVLSQITRHGFHNTSDFTLPTLLHDHDHVGGQPSPVHPRLRHGDPGRHRQVRLRDPDRGLERSNLLYKVVARFCDIDTGCSSSG